MPDVVAASSMVDFIVKTVTAKLSSSKSNTSLKQRSRNCYEFKKRLKCPCPAVWELRLAAGSNQTAVLMSTSSAEPH